MAYIVEFRNHTSETLMYLYLQNTEIEVLKLIINN